MEINGKSAAELVKVLAETALAKQTHTIAVLSNEADGKQFFRWGSNKGDWYSPVFDDSRECMKYAEDIGLKKLNE